MSTFEKTKVFTGRCFKPRFENIIAEVSLTVEDIDKLRDWALANEGRITLQVSRAKSGKVYSEINTYKKNPPDSGCGKYAQSNELPSSQYQREPRREEQPQYKQESRYGRDDRPAPLPEPPPTPEVSREEDDDIPF